MAAELDRPFGCCTYCYTGIKNGCNTRIWFRFGNGFDKTLISPGLIYVYMACFPELITKAFTKGKAIAKLPYPLWVPHGGTRKANSGSVGIVT